MTQITPDAAAPKAGESAEESPASQAVETPAKPEHGGPKGLEPTRYGDWERNGRCFDF